MIVSSFGLYFFLVNHQKYKLINIKSEIIQQTYRSNQESLINFYKTNYKYINELSLIQF